MKDINMRAKREIAEDLVIKLFEDAPQARVLISDATALAAERGISYTTLARAIREAGIKTVRNGSHGGYWKQVS